MFVPARAAGPRCCRLLATVSCSLLASSYGLAIGWAVVANWQLQRPGDRLSLEPAQRAWLLSALYGGVAAGSLIGGRLGTRLGPRGVLVVSAPVILAASGVIFFASSYGVLIAGRLLSGLSCGMPSAVYTLYISGTSKPAERGMLFTLSEILIVSGTVVAVAAGQVLSWRWLAVLCAAIAAVPSAALLLLLPSDPVWLLGQRRSEEAQIAADVFGLELSQMAATGSGEKDAASDGQPEPAGWRDSLRQLTRRSSWAPLVLVLTLFFFRAFSGYYGILAYSLEFLRGAGFELDAYLSAILFGGVTVVAAILTSLLIDRVGRRPLLLASTGGTCLCYAGLVLFYQVPALNSLTALPITLLLTAGFVFYVGLGSVPYCLVGELFPVRIRPLGCSLVPVAYCAFSSTALLLFPPTVETLGPSGMFFCHAVAMATAFCVVLFALPETRGLPLSHVETLFERHAGPVEKEATSAAQTVENGGRLSCNAEPVSSTAGLGEN